VKVLRFSSPEQPAAHLAQQPTQVPRPEAGCEIAPLTIGPLALVLLAEAALPPQVIADYFARDVLLAPSKVGRHGR
jgi:hypothetical protein